MKLYLDIASSVEFWRQRYPSDRMPKAPPPVVYEESAYKKSDIDSLKPAWLNDEFLAPTGGVLHVLSFNHSHRRRLKSFHVHAWGGPLPEGAFYELQPGLRVETPEFMFLQAATLLDLVQLIAFGDELCGLYSFDRRQERGFTKRKQPLTTKSRLERFLKMAANCHGRALAEKALRYVVERSASPMETLDEMTMCLPYRYGGYNLLTPIMNHRIDLTPKAARIAKQVKCYLDMGYLDFYLDVEHHGKLDHSTDEDKSSDRARVNALKEMGFEVIELTIDQVGDLFAYEYIIERIAGIIGRRLRKEHMGATSERLKLRCALFDWNSSYGAIRS